MPPFTSLKDGIRTLQDNPHRCPATLEDATLRQWVYGNKPHVYRVLYRVLEKSKQVEILHIRHGAMDAFGAADVEGREE